MASSDTGRFTLARINRDYPITEGSEVDLWAQSAARLDAYNRFWRFYRGNHWSYIPETGDPVTTLNFIQKFVDKHCEYLFGSGFTVHTNRGYGRNGMAEDLLNGNWEAQGEEFLTQMAQIGGVTGDCWVNLGYDIDPIFGERIKYTVMPSEYVFPLFNRMSQREPDALLTRWPDQEIVGSPNYGTRMRFRTITRGQYWTKNRVWDMVNDKPLDLVGRPNILGELPWVHIPNLLDGTNFWGRSDLSNIVDIQRELNEKITDVGDIINYHGAPITLVFGAKASQLVAGANKLWTGLPIDAKVENLELQGDLGAANQHIQLLKDTMFQLASMTGAAFGGAEYISNTSGVAIALQFAPIVEHMKTRRKMYGTGIQKINYKTLKFFEVMGQYKPPRVNPYYSFPKWGNPLPRDNQLELANLMTMHQVQLLSRVQMLRQLIAHDVAPADIDYNEVADVLDEALAEELRYSQLLAAAAAPPLPGPPGSPPPPSILPPPALPGESANEARSSQVEQQANAAATR